MTLIWADQVPAKPKARRLAFYGHVTYEPRRGEPRTEPKTICEECMAVIRRWGGWGIVSTNLPNAEAAQCGECRNRREAL